MHAFVNENMALFLRHHAPLYMDVCVDIRFCHVRNKRSSMNAWTFATDVMYHSAWMYAILRGVMICCMHSFLNAWMYASDIMHQELQKAIDPCDFKDTAFCWSHLTKCWHESYDLHKEGMTRHWLRCIPLTLCTTRFPVAINHWASRVFSVLWCVSLLIRDSQWMGAMAVIAVNSCDIKHQELLSKLKFTGMIRPPTVSASPTHTIFLTWSHIESDHTESISTCACHLCTFCLWSAVTSMEMTRDP